MLVTSLMISQSNTSLRLTPTTFINLAGAILSVNKNSKRPIETSFLGILEIFYLDFIETFMIFSYRIENRPRCFMI